MRRRRRRGRRRSTRNLFSRPHQLRRRDEERDCRRGCCDEGDYLLSGWDLGGMEVEEGREMGLEGKVRRGDDDNDDEVRRSTFEVREKSGREKKKEDTNSQLLTATREERMRGRRA